MNYKSILSGTLVATTLLSTGISAVPAQAKELGLYPKIEVPTDKSKAPKKYAMIAKFTEKSKLEFLSAKNKLKSQKTSSGETVQTYVGLDKSDCGKDLVRYTNVGLWEGKAVDVVYRLDSVTKAGFKGGEWIRFNTGSIGLTQGGYKEIKVTQHFVYHDTQKDAPITGSYMTFNDIDAHQAFGFSDATMKKVSKIYIAESAKKWIDVTEKNGMTYFGSPSDNEIDSDDLKGKMTMLFDGNAITYSFVKDWTGYNLGKKLDYANSEYNQYFGYKGEKPVRTETLAPTKLVSDKNEKDKKENTLDTASEEYTYIISHSVPAEEKQFFYKSYEMDDTLIPELEIVKDSLKVTNSDGKDVTNLFENQTKGNQVKVIAKKDTLTKSEFYGKDYKFNFKVKVKAGTDLSKLKDKDGKITILNTATVTKDSMTVKTNTVTTELTPKKEPTPPATPNKVEKFNVISGKESKEVAIVEAGKNHQYVIKYTPTNKDGAKTKTLVLSDDLPDAMDLKAIKVLCDGKDVTGQGTLAKDDKTEKFTWTAKDAKSFVGKQLVVTVDSSLKPMDLSTFKNQQGAVIIPNKAEIDVDGNKTTSNEVDVTSPQKKTPIVENKVEKFNTDKGKNTKETVTLEKGQSHQYTVEYTPTNKDEDKTKTLVLSDDLPDAMDLKNVKISCEGKDVTSQGTLAKDDKTEKFTWTAQDPKAFIGKKLTATIGSELKKDFDPKAFVKDDAIVIPNKAEMDVDGNKTTSNEVDVTTPQEKPKVIPQTGHDKMKFIGGALLGLAGVGCAGYGVYYFMKRKHS